jgi:hypothetical protein
MTPEVCGSQRFKFLLRPCNMYICLVVLVHSFVVCFHPHFPHLESHLHLRHGNHTKIEALGNPELLDESLCRIMKVIDITAVYDAFVYYASS